MVYHTIGNATKRWKMHWSLKRDATQYLTKRLAQLLGYRYIYTVMSVDWGKGGAICAQSGLPDSGAT